MPIIQVDHLTKEYRLGAMQGRKQAPSAPRCSAHARLEKMGYLDVDNWLAWREVCNWLAHEYPDQPEVRFAALMAAIDAAKSLNKKQLSVA
jgi:hypothetical protein